MQVSTSAFPSLGMLGLQTLGLTRLAAFDRYRMTRWERREARRVEVVSGCAMFVRGAALREVGPLDESFFFYGEETDWCRRFAQAGWEVWFAPVGEITHFGGGSVRALNHRRDVLLTEGTVRLHRKHGGLGAGLACWSLLAGFNLSRALVWQALRLTRRPGASARAAHFARVVRDLPRAWPREARA
jgi:GT2 family glycosyltransferase